VQILFYSKYKFRLCLSVLPLDEAKFRTFPAAC
jgi:hypothetical protein